MHAPAFDTPAASATARGPTEDSSVSDLITAWRNALRAGHMASRLMGVLYGLSVTLPPRDIFPECYTHFDHANADDINTPVGGQLTWRLSAKPVPRSSCLVVAADGAQAIDLVTAVSSPASALPQTIPASAALLPRWDPARRALFYGDLLVKKYGQRAKSQTLILAAFDELRWTSRIDDPLPPQSGRDRKQHLRETVRSLNLCQKNRLLTFRADGTGTGVCWEPRA